MDLMRIMEEVIMLQEEQKQIEIEVQNYFAELKYIESLILETECIFQEHLESQELWKHCY